MSSTSVHDLQPGQKLFVENRRPTAMKVTVAALIDGTKVEVLLTPGAEVTITKGTGEVSVTINDADGQFPGPGLALVEPDA